MSTNVSSLLRKSKCLTIFSGNSTQTNRFKEEFQNIEKLDYHALSTKNIEKIFLIQIEVIEKSLTFFKYKNGEIGSFLVRFSKR